MWANILLTTMLVGTLMVIASIILSSTDSERASVLYPLGLLIAGIGFAGLLIINQQDSSPTDRDQAKE